MQFNFSQDIEPVYLCFCWECSNIRANVMHSISLASTGDGVQHHRSPTVKPQAPQKLLSEKRAQVSSTRTGAS